MILPVQCTPLNSNEALNPWFIKKSYGRYYNRTAACRICRGTVMGNRSGRRFTGKCSVCGQVYTRNLRCVENKWLNILLAEFENYDPPDVKLWSPEWASELTLPLLESMKESFLFCTDIRELMNRLYEISWISRCLNTRRDHRSNFHRGPCWIALLESSPGCPAGLQILSARTEEKVYFETRRSNKPSIFSKRGNVSGHFLKMAPELDSMCEHWSELQEEFLEDLLGERVDRTVLVHQTV